LTVPNTRAEHDRLVATLASLGRPVIVGFEPTGNYHRGLAHRLIAAGFEARLISSMALARTREALHNGWDKNDPKDAQVILHMLRIGASTVYNDPGCGRLNDLQELSKTHDMVSRAKTELWHRLLTHYLPLYFPEVERFHGTSRSDWFLALLEQFPTPASITALPRRPSWRPPGTWLAGRSPRHACWAISTRRRARPWLCRCGQILRPSRCSAWSSAKAAA
jgi:hypothetical protein